MKQESFSDMEYGCRKKKTKREEFLEIMDEIIPWDELVSLIVPHYPSGRRGRPPIEIETMLRMYLLQCWFTLSDEGVKDAIYDSYAMRKFMGINFLEQDVPDAATLPHFRHRWRTRASAGCFLTRSTAAWSGPDGSCAAAPLWTPR